MISGIGISAIRVRSPCIEDIKEMDRISKSTMRNTLVSCSDRKFFVVSMSDVQRWMMSPVRFFICQEKGRRWIWENSRSRIVFTRVSDALVLYTRKV